MSEASSSGRIRLVAHGLTDVGRQRRHNEDHVCVMPDLDLFVVADGMGGHNAGDVASALTTKSLENFFQATQQGMVLGEPPADEVDLSPEARRLVAAIRKANNDVFEISSTYQQHQGMGSTVVAVHVAPAENLVHIAHVGDSRCYRIRDGIIEQLTRDHSLVNEALAIKPDLTPDELARLPKNIITRALGMKGDIKVDLRTVETMPGDLFLLCSDGLSGMVEDQELAEILAITDDLCEACELLIAMANDAGGADNITAVLIRCDPDPAREPSSPELSYDADELALLSALMTPDAAELLESGIDVDIDKPKLSSSAPSGMDAADPASGMDAAEPASGMDAADPASGMDAADPASGMDAAEPASGTGARRSVRCRCCDYEILEGNRFCVECGTLIHW